MRRNLSPISCRLLGCETIMVWYIPVVCLDSRLRLELLSRVCLIIIDVWGTRFMSVGPLWPRPLHIISSTLLRVHHWIQHIDGIIWLPTFPRGMTASVVVTTIVLTIRPTLTLSMSPTIGMMILLLTFILDILSRRKNSLVTLSILILSLLPLILLWSPVVPLIMIMFNLTILTRMPWLFTLDAPHSSGMPPRLYMRRWTRLLAYNY